MSDIAVRVENLGKCYQIGQAKSGDFRQSFGSWMDKLRGRGGEQIAESKEFWALKDVSFEIKKGEAVGIIGRNGAGKSTLLKILSRITEPTKGRFEINGRVSSLLEVGTGFHPELSGRENIFLNGTILGMKRREIKAKFDEIVAFSGVEKFIDTPVKHYSSGMKVRLAFSVAAHLEPEILIIDEVLAVGDAEFQKKCLGKMDEVSKSGGRTVLFVSHNMAAVEGLCARGILLGEGRVSKIGSSIEVITSYLSVNENYEANLSKRVSTGSKRVIFTQMQVLNEEVEFKIVEGCFQVPFYSNIKFILQLKKIEAGGILYFAITLRDISGVKIVTFDNLYSNTGIHMNDRGNVQVVECFCEKLPLNPGNYTVDLWCSDGYETFHNIENACSLEIVANNFYSTGKMHTREKHGFLNIINTWKAANTEH